MENLEQPKNIQSINTADDLVNVLKNTFATTAIKIYVNSLNKEITFREITVNEQKTLTRIMSSNERRKDIIYNAQCALINQACVTEGFNINDLLEFDRLKLMIALYQSNMSSNEVKFICDECGAENKYQIDFNNALIKLDGFDLSPKKFHYENKNFSYDFEVQYPSVKTVSSFYEQYCRTHGRVSKKDIHVDESMQNMEYVNLFIKNVTFKALNSNKNTQIDFSAYPVSSYEKILSVFPQDVLYSDSGVLKFIIKEMIQPLNDAFDKHECYNCGTLHEKENTNQVESFF